jgi:hypothetical protein
VSFFKPKFVLLALVSVLLPALWTSGCSGGDFSAASGEATAGTAAQAGSDSSGGKGSAGTSSNAGTGTGAGTGVACGGPEDCDDKNVCTTDRCNADGTCDASPKCTGSDKCCGGDCAQCCKDADCDDGVSCTMNTCFSGQCMFVPDDTQCAATEYCSAADGCKTRQACTGLAGESASVCDDGGGCTTDACENHFCQHHFCPNADAKLCCEGKGCAACCTDAQCDDDKDPCTVGSCKDGKCSKVPLCADGLECCPNADGTTATCGKCCKADECDDKIACTEDKCGGGQCSNTPQNTLCPMGYLCDPAQKMCTKAPDCTVNADCHPTGCQSNPKCNAGKCQFDSCAIGTKCCSNNSCAACCADTECNDNTPCTTDKCGTLGCENAPNDALCPQGYLCNADHGCVLGCKTDSNCQLRMVTTNIATPPIGTGCSVSKCVKGQCEDVLLQCGDLQTCCQASGTCTLPGKCFETQ